MHDLRVVRLPLTMRAWGLRSLTGLRGYTLAIRRLLPLVRREGVTEVYCGRCVPEGVMALALKLWAGLPYACFVHGEESGQTGREYYWLVRRVFRGAEFLIANTRNTMRSHAGRLGGAGEPTPPTAPGRQHDAVHAGQRDPAVREALGWGDRPVVLTVSRLQLRKGHDQMILALRAIRSTVPDVLYAIAGDGEERLRLQDLVVREGLEDHVQLLGEVDEDQLLRCYQQCDLFVLPNRQVGRDIEGFGMVLLEARPAASRWSPVPRGARPRRWTSRRPAWSSPARRRTGWPGSSPSCSQTWSEAQDGLGRATGLSRTSIGRAWLARPSRSSHSDHEASRIDSLSSRDGSDDSDRHGRATWLLILLRPGHIVTKSLYIIAASATRAFG